MLSPVAAVTHPNPYPYYASLVAERPFGFDDSVGMWVAASAPAVERVLGEPRCAVRPAAEPVPRGIVGTAAGEVFGNLVRMTDGDLQRRLKQVVVDTLAQVDHQQVADVAAERARRVVATGDPGTVRDLMFAVPAQVVAALCGLDEGASVEAARLIGEFVQCIPASATPDQLQTAAHAADQLQRLLGKQLDETANGLLGALVRAATSADWESTAPLLANGIGFLSQTYDATAGLIGNSLVALAVTGHDRPDSPEVLAGFVREVVRYDAPVQNTRRFAAESFAIDGTEVQAGQAILVLLAAANRDPAVNPDPGYLRVDRQDPVVFTFGAAAHRCPGEKLAVTIATAVLGELLSSGYEPADQPQPAAYRPSPNARIPAL